MALKIDLTAIPQFEVDIVHPGGDKEYHLSVPTLRYLPPEVAAAGDQWVTDRTAEVQANRDTANEEKRDFSSTDPMYQYPTELQLMDKFLELLDPKGAKIIAAMPLGFREQINKAWGDASKETDPGKSSASSNSSDATE